MCGAVVPEGTQVCYICKMMGEHGYIRNPYSNTWTKKPHFHVGQTLKLKGSRTGIVRVVDEFGTFEQNEEPSYDIEMEVDGKPVLYKHLRQSIVDDLARYPWFIQGN